MANKCRVAYFLGMVAIFVTIAVMMTLAFTVWNDDVEENGPGPCDPGDTRDDYIANGTDIIITTDLPVYLVEPVGSCLGAVIVVHDIYGYELGATRLIADELAMHGYTAALPDLFRGNPWTPGGNPADYIRWSESHPQERVDEDTETMIEYLQTDMGIENVGIIGFCWGGTQTVLSSRTTSSKIQAGVSFYGSSITDENVLAMTAPTMLIFGENDTLIPLETVYGFEDVLRSANRLLSDINADDSGLSGPASYVKVFEDVGHAFAHRANRSDPVAAAASDEAKEDMYTWLGRYLPVEDTNTVLDDDN